MNRCCICDYIERFGSEYLDKEASRTVIVRKAKDGEFYCSDCSDEIYLCLITYDTEEDAN